MSQTSIMERRLIGTTATFSPSGDVTGIDVEGLARRLILFDQFIFNSVRFKEFLGLVRHLGYEGVRDLLSANMLEIRCECLQVAQVGQSGIFKDPVLPLLSYKFNWVDSHDKRKYIHDCLQIIHEIPGLKFKDVLRLKRSIADALSPLPKEARSWLASGFLSDLNNAELVKASVSLALERHLGQGGIPFKFTLHQEGQERFKVETNIADITRLNDVETHKVVEAGLLGVATLSQVIGEMKAYNALSGFRDKELPLFKAKLGFLASVASTEQKESRFQSVIDLAGMPKVTGDGAVLDVDRLLKIRNSSETREFRDWLASGASENESEIRRQVTGFRSQAGLKVGSATGKAMRFLVTSAVGFIPSPVASLVSVGLGALDTFVLDKILPRSGITAFVSELYPSIFEAGKDSSSP